MSVVQKAASGIAWTILVSISSRAVGLASMLVVTRFLTPAEYGEVQVAAVLVFTTGVLTSFGLPNYMVAKAKASPQVHFAAALFYVLIGVVTLGGILLFQEPIAGALGDPAIQRFFPGLVLAGLLNRIAVPNLRALAIDLRFPVIAMSNAIGEISFGVVTVVLAWRGWGGYSVVVGNIVRCAFLLVISTAATRAHLWRTPWWPDWSTVRDLFRFGIPIWIGVSAVVVSMKWDNLLVARLFGSGPVGKYNLAYNLADIPAVHVGEHVGDVLLPSFARLEPERRPAALVRATGMLSLIMAPLAVGLGAVAPTLVELIFDPRWYEVGPMLTLLAGLAVVRPIGWTVNVFLQANDHPRVVMVLGLFRMVSVLALIAALAPLGLYWACAAPGVAFTVHSLIGIAAVRWTSGVSGTGMLSAMIRPILATVPMIAAVLAVRAALDGTAPAVGLLAEIAAGAIVYVPCAFLFARGAAKELLGIARRLIRR